MVPLNIQNLNKAFPEYETNSLKNKGEITSATCIKENTKGHLTYYSVSDPSLTNFGSRYVSTMGNLYIFRKKHSDILNADKRVILGCAGL